MSRAATAADRVVVTLVALALIAVGVLAVAWPLDLLPGLPDRLTAPWTGDLTGQGWWPAALAVAGVVLVLVGLRWLVAHRPAPRVHDMTLPGSGPSGRLRTDLSSIAGAAAQALEAEGPVRSVRGRAFDDRGRRTLEFVVTIDPGTSMGALSPALDRTLEQLGSVIGPDTAVRARVRVARRAAAAGPRVV